MEKFLIGYTTTRSCNRSIVDVRFRWILFFVFCTRSSSILNSGYAIYFKGPVQPALMDIVNLQEANNNYLKSIEALKSSYMLNGNYPYKTNQKEVDRNYQNGIFGYENMLVQVQRHLLSIMNEFETLLSHIN